MSYLADLTLRLAAGASRFRADFRARQAAALAARQQPDGGFAGRRGASDLYYTGFGVRGLAILGALDDDRAQKTAAYLRTHLDRRLAPIDFLSLAFTAFTLDALSNIDVFRPAGRALADEVLRHAARLRRPDGGYAKSERAPQSSTYHTFLTAACLDLVGRELEEPERTLELLRQRQRPDGGFVEGPAMTRSGTNPTAAAVGLLRMLGADCASLRPGAASFLAGMQSPEGGLRAHDRIPIADLLSTFTGLVALRDLGRLDAVDLAAAAGYAESLETPAAGFRGAAWDEAADVEYTFYGIGVAALAQNEPPARTRLS